MEEAEEAEAADVASEGAAERALAKLDGDAATRLIASYLDTHKLVLTKLLQGSGSEEAAEAPAAAPAERGEPTQSTATKGPSLERRMSSPLPVINNRCRLGQRMYEVTTINPHSVNAQLLVKPETVFHGERSSEKREAAHHHSFPLRVVYDGLTSGLEANPRFKCRVGQVLGARYKVLQYIGSGTFGHTVHCEDLHCTDARHRWVCVKISKSSKDVFDQNLWEVKVLKLLRERMGEDEDEIAKLPALLDVFYFRETLFVVYELLRDNLYHIYKYLGEQKMPGYFTPARCREVARQVLLTLKALHKHGVIHADLKPENILIESLASCRVRVIDYGNASLVGDEHSSYIQSRQFRAPEVILGVDYSTKADLWSLGCILMELATGRLLFDQGSIQQLLASHIALRGPIPTSMLVAGKLARHYFAGESCKHLVRMYDDGTVVRLSPRKDVTVQSVLERHGIHDEHFADLVRQLLTIDPAVRPSAAAALEHAWFAQGAAEPLEVYAADAMFGELSHAPPSLSEQQESSSSREKLALRYPSLREEEEEEEEEERSERPPAGEEAESAPAEVRDERGRGAAPAALRSSRASQGEEVAHSAPPAVRGTPHEAAVAAAKARVSARLSGGSDGGSIEEELPGPLTPPDFRKQSYAEREKQTAAARQPPARNRKRGSRLSSFVGLIKGSGGAGSSGARRDSR